MTNREADDARSEARSVRNEAQGAQNHTDIEQLTVAVDELVASNERNEQGIGTVATMMADAAKDRYISRYVRGVLIIITFIAASYFYADLNQARNQRDEIERLVERLVDVQAKVIAATTPDGCTFRRAEAFRSKAVLNIQNDIRKYHGQPPLTLAADDQALIDTPCPGE